MAKRQLSIKSFFDYSDKQESCKSKAKCDESEKNQQASSSNTTCQLNVSNYSEVSKDYFDNCDGSDGEEVFENKESTRKKMKVNYNKNWETKYQWIYFDEQRGGAFCRYCEKFLINDSEALQKSGGVFIIKPFLNYRKATGKSGKLEKHAQSAKHLHSISLQKMAEQNKKMPIQALITTESEKQKCENRKSLSALISSLYFLVKEEIPHTTKYEPLLQKIVLKNNDPLNKWAQDQSIRSTYLSKATGSEFLSCIGEILDRRDAQKVNNRPFSLMADESTNTSNISELSILLRYVNDVNIVQEMFLCLVELPNADALTITSTIIKELSIRHINLENIVACAFDGAATFSGNISGVKQRLSEIVKRDIPYVHCRAHILSLALTSARNKHSSIKRIFHVVKDIYKLFHKSSKREKLLHNVQAILEEPVLKIPQTIEIRWLSNYRSIHAVKICYVAIMMTCEHIHKEGADLASLAGGILLEMSKSSFLITLCILEEALFAVYNLSNLLQKKTLTLSCLPTIISSTYKHLGEVADHCLVENSELFKNFEELMVKASSVRTIVQDEPVITTTKLTKKFVDSMIEQMKSRFSDQAISLINITAKFYSPETFNNLNSDDVKNLCSLLNINDVDSVWADIRSFKYVTDTLKNANSDCDNLIQYILQSNIGYENLKKLCIRILCIPVSTASAERSFSTMNRINTDLRNRIGQETLNFCMKISIEGPEELENDVIDEVLDLYARKKNRRIRLL